MRKRAVLIILMLIPVAVLAAAVVLYVSLPSPDLLRSKNPETTAYMQLKCPSGCSLQWTSLQEISPLLIQSVLKSEDSSFFLHGAVSLSVFREAIKENFRRGSMYWGGSTITMQLARNLYLWPERTPWRKFCEILLAYKLESSLTKNRILEIYLNVVEWGPSVFGIGNASTHYFAKSPRELGPREAVFLASILPGPAKLNKKSLTQQFDRNGALLFDHIVRMYLPGRRVSSSLEDCKERLNDAESSMVDEILLNLFSRFGAAIARGDVLMMSKDKWLEALDAEQKAFIDDLLSRQSVASDNRFDCQMSIHSIDDIPAPSTCQSGGIRLYAMLREIRSNGYCLSPFLQSGMKQNEAKATK